MLLFLTTSIHILYQIQTLQCTHPSIFSLYTQYLSFLGTAITISRNLAARRNIYSKALLLHMRQPPGCYSNLLVLPLLIHLGPFTFSLFRLSHFHS